LLILNNDEIDSLLSMSDSVDLLERAYRALAEGRAVNRPRSDLYHRDPGSDTVYVFKTMEGGSLDSGVAALRLCSDVIRWEKKKGSIVKQKLPVAAGGKWVGLVLLFSIETAEPLAIFPDGVVQVTRVAATSAVAARHLARKDASILGLIGSGWQARAHVRAMCAVRKIEKVHVYSPTKANRETFAKEMEGKVNIPIIPVNEPEEAANEADILVAATNAISQIVFPKWLQPGMHVTCIKDSELGEDTIRSADQVVIHARKFAPENYITGFGGEKIEVHDPIAFLQEKDQSSVPKLEPPFWTQEPEIQDVVVGQAEGRTSAEQITCFINNIGTGIQFNALGAAVYRQARSKGVGREIPTDWFLESVHN
jgi:alanine dehydrogenase